MLGLKVINSDATVNNFIDIGNATIIRGEDAKLNLILFQNDKKIRYIASSSAVITMDLLNSDNTTLHKTAMFPFVDDRSVIQFTLSDSETLSLISQNLLVSVVEGSITTFALLQFGLQMVNLTQGC